MEEQPKTKIPRPELLKLLCILTFIGSGLSMLSNVALFSVIDQIREMFAEDPIYMVFGVEMNMSIFLNVNPWFFMIQAVLYSLSFSGALQMWKLNKIGFHIYSVAQILLLIVPKIFIPDMPFPAIDLILTGSFIYFYYLNVKFMH
ncbi:MAG TPA: hypothetical protein VIN10_11475 [Bacteroidales bacterium]